MIDVAKHQAKHNEIDRRMSETISTFMAKEEYYNDPMAALQACREVVREATAQPTPIKEMEAFAEKVAARILARERAASEAVAKQPDSQTSHRGEETAAESKPVKVAHSEGKSSLISRLEAVEAVMATTPTQQVTPNPLVSGMLLMFIHVGRMHVVWSVAGVPTKPSAAMEETSTNNTTICK